MDVVGIWPADLTWTQILTLLSKKRGIEVSKQTNAPITKTCIKMMGKVSKHMNAPITKTCIKMIGKIGLSHF